MNLTNFDPLSLVILLAAMSLLPLLMICTTCFLKVSMVMVIVRNAIGVQQVPPSLAIYSLALVVTGFVMAPVFHEVSTTLGFKTTSARTTENLSLAELLVAAEPLRKFMVSNTLPEQRQHFLGIARKQWPADMARTAKDTDYMVLIPAFVVSEMQLALEVGFVLYIPFVVIDLVLSNLLLALGMQMVSPMVVSLPLKILLFVMLDGWTRLVDGLVQSYT
jgi:type III secretion protein R